ncbi:MAG: multidrug effflux MFS transporter [Chthoniobacteraceae bacterium]
MKFKPDSIGFTLLLATLSSLPPLSTDLYLSALSVMGKALGCSPTLAGLSISVFLGSFAFSQLIFGPLADRYGRRPVGIWGCLLFTVSSIGTTAAGSIGALLLWRGLQGTGAGAVCMLAFAIVRDLFHGDAGRTRYAYINATRAFAPMIAPLLGSWIYQMAGWRATLGVTALFGAGLTLAFAMGFEESLAPRNRQSISPRALCRNYLFVLSNRITLGYCAVNAFLSGAILSFITGSSFVFVDFLGISRPHFGAILFATACGVMIGSAAAGKLSTHGFSGKKMLWGSLAMHLTATSGLFALSLTHRFSPYTAVPLLMLMNLSSGLVNPGTVHGALAPMGRMAGTASAVFGCLGMMGGALASAAVSWFHCDTPPTLTGVMAFCSLMALGSYALVAARERAEDLAGVETQEAVTESL